MILTEKGGLYLTGARIEEIQHILGHETPGMTYRYLGLNANDQAAVLSEYDSFIQSIDEGAVQTFSKNGKFSD